MDFALNEEQKMVQNMARGYFTDKVSRNVILELEASDIGYSPELWSEIADLGWMGLPIPEEFGGSGESFLTTAVLLEEIGRSAFISPYFSTVILGAFPIIDFGTENQKKQYLPEIAAGKKIITMALTEPKTRYGDVTIDVEAKKDGGYYVINGVKLFVPNASIADYVICAAKTSGEGITVFIVDAKSSGIKLTPLKLVSGEKFFEVEFNQVRVSEGNILGMFDKGNEIIKKVLQRAAVAECCQMVGGMQKSLEMTAEYVKGRVQYGRPIGSFQAIQHFLANMAIDIDGSRFTTYNAAWLISQNKPCEKEVAIAKSWASDTYRHITRVAHQVHGALGFTVDHDLQFYLRRALTAAPAYGDSRYYEKKISELITAK